MIRGKIEEIKRELHISSDASFDSLPKQRVDGKILTVTGTPLCRLDYKDVANRGSHGIIQKAIRFGNTVQKGALVAVKRPRTPSQDLILEGVVQALAAHTVAKEGLLGAVPTIHDIFVFANEVRITMDWVEGVSCSEYLKGRGEREILDVIIQIAIILDCLERQIRLDHRDLKLDNIWIRETPVSYRVELDGGAVANYNSNFQVVILDFGFACIGAEYRRMLYNLGGVIPDIDYCPKVGRDMYHIISRLLERRDLRDSLSPSLKGQFIEWMKPYTVHPSPITHLITSDLNFGVEALCPRAILEWYFSQ